MPTKRKRVSAGRRVPSQVLMLLGMGSGMHSIPEERLRELWRAWREPVTREWRARFNAEPFVAEIAREEGWADADEA